MDYRARINEEFSRQAETFLAATALTEHTLVDRIVNAIAPMEAMRILDLGCGPGIITTALAPMVGEVVAVDLTREMLQKARERCLQAGVENVRFQLGTAESLPYRNGTFDTVVTRLTIHHFEDPKVAMLELARATRACGKVVVADIVTSEDHEEAELHNALEVLRDPSHVRMLPSSRLLSIMQESSLSIVSEAIWEQQRRFDEWVRIVNDPGRTAPLHTVMLYLANAGSQAGIDLHVDGDTIAFTHHWLLVTAEKLPSP